MAVTEQIDNRHDSSLIMVTGQSNGPIIPRIDEIPNPLRPQLIEDRDKIPLVSTQQRTVLAYAGSNVIQQQLGFAAAAVTVHNATKYWWYLRDANIFVPPATVNLNVNFEIKPQSCNIEFLAPVDFPQPAVADPTSFAIFVYGDKPLAPTTVIVPPAGGGTGTDVNATIVGPLDAGDVAVKVENFPATQPVSGSVAVNNFPATQPVSGTVSANASLPSTTPYHLISLASTNANLVAAGARLLAGIIVINQNAALRFLKIFNKATAPVPGTDTPVMNIPIPANGAGANFGGGLVFVPTYPISFPLGLGFALTGGQADNDATAIGAGDVVVDFVYV